MTTCVPVRDMKNTAEFAELVERERNVTVTRNGYELMHCLSGEEYRLIQEEAAKAKLLSRMMLAEREYETGAFSDYDEFAHDLRDRYGL